MRLIPRLITEDAPAEHSVKSPLQLMDVNTIATVTAACAALPQYNVPSDNGQLKLRDAERKIQYSILGNYDRAGLLQCQ